MIPFRGDQLIILYLHAKCDTCMQVVLYRVAQKEWKTLIVNFKNIVDETDFFFFFFHLVEHSFSNKMTPWSLILGKVPGS